MNLLKSRNDRHMWAKFPTNIHLFCSFCFAGVFSSKKVCFDIIQVIIWMACFSHVHYVYFSFCSQYDVYIIVLIRLGRGLFCAYSGSHMAQFKHTLWSYEVTNTVVCHIIYYIEVETVKHTFSFMCMKLLLTFCG